MGLRCFRVRLGCRVRRGVAGAGEEDCGSVWDIWCQTGRTSSAAVSGGDQWHIRDPCAGISDGTADAQPLAAGYAVFDQRGQDGRVRARVGGVWDRSRGAPDGHLSL